MSLARKWKIAYPEMTLSRLASVFLDAMLSSSAHLIPLWLSGILDLHVTGIAVVSKAEWNPDYGPKVLTLLSTNSCLWSASRINHCFGIIRKDGTKPKTSVRHDKTFCWILKSVRKWTRVQNQNKTERGPSAIFFLSTAHPQSPPFYRPAVPRIVFPFLGHLP